MATLSQEDLDAAAKAVMRDTFRDEVPDIIRNQDFPVMWPALRERLLEKIQAGTYRPRHPEIVEVPKSELATRPIAVLDLADRVVYEAVLTKLSHAIDAELSEEVHSARLRTNKKGKVVRPDQRKAWVGFQRAGREYCDRYDEVCMLTTDITSYFEFVDLGDLLAGLRLTPGIDVDDVNLLATILHGLEDGSELNGLPQGPEVSSFLGNFYLRPLDSILRKLDVKFIRFQDDIKVFATDTAILRRAVHQLTPVVRGLHLNLSSAKTRILTGEAVLEHFEDARKDALQYRIDVGDGSVVEDIRELFDDAVAGRVNERDVRFAVYRLSRFNDDHAVTWILDHLAEVPYLSELLVQYLGDHVSDNAEIEPRVVEFIRDPSSNISPFVEMHLVRLLANLHSMSDESYQLMWDLLMNPATDTRSRQFAARAVGRHLTKKDTADLNVLLGLFHKSGADRALRRALLVALREGGDADTTFLNQVSLGSPDLEATCRYLRTNPKLPDP